MSKEGTNYFQSIKHQFNQGDIVIKLMYSLITLFFVFSISRVIEFIFRLPNPIFSLFFKEWLAIPASLNQLSYKFYTLFTYQFLHFDFLHLFINVIMLFYFGRLILQFMRFKKVLPLYLLGGVAGGLTYAVIVYFNIIVVYPNPVVGASASIMALMGASAMIAPNYSIKFFFADIKLKWLVLGFAVLNLLSMYNPEGAASGILHLAGLGFGYAYVYLDKEGVSLYKPVNKLINYMMVWFNKAPHPKVTFVNTDKRTQKTTPDKQRQEQIDYILNKISKHGYDSLTQEEKDILFRTSNN